MVRFFATRLSPRIYFFFNSGSKKNSLLLIGDSLPLSPSDCTAETFFFPLVSYEKTSARCADDEILKSRFTMDISQFSLRNVNNKASNLPAKALDGGLRVHIPTKHLTSAALRHGEYCQLDQTDGRPKAIGVAWLAKDPGQGTKRMAFIEEPMKELFGVRLEDKVTITKLEPQELQPAQKIYIKEVEPGSSSTSKAEIEWFAKYALCTCIIHTLLFTWSHSFRTITTIHSRRNVNIYCNSADLSPQVALTWYFRVALLQLPSQEVPGPVSRIDTW